MQVIEDLSGSIEEIRRFKEFTEDNDPYGEHEFGTIHWYGEKVFWKIDYYDQQLEYGKEPLSPNCRRVMTVTLGMRDVFQAFDVSALIKVKYRL